MTIDTTNTKTRYKIGIDVGTHSTGYCAIEVDDNDYPIRLLNSVVYVHDSGIDPGSNKTAATRLAVSGIKRRAQRLLRRRKQRLVALDKWIIEQGWPIVDLEEENNPYLPWLVRAELADGKVDQQRLGRMLSIALRHMARHRGWRSPYSKVRSLYVRQEPSTQLQDLVGRVTALTGRSANADETPAQIITTLNLHLRVPLRGPQGILGGKLMQSDNANELHRIAEVQNINADLLHEMINHVFTAKSPRGSATGRVGKDSLPGQEHLHRCMKVDESFQHFRIASVVGNLRIHEKGSDARRLDPSEQEKVINYLMYEAPLNEQITWYEVADLLNINRNALKGTAATGPDGERIAGGPPVNETDRRMRKVPIKKIANWWKNADKDQRRVLVYELSNAGDTAEAEELLPEINELLETLTDEEMEKLSTLVLPAGRAAYSIDSLERLTKRMLNDGIDLTEARMSEFGVDGSWTPPADPIGHPVGNPAVDRVTKQAARYLFAAEKKWGAPLSVNIEHVRNALGSEAMARKLDRENNQRAARNREIYAQMHKQLGLEGRPLRSDLTRYLAIQRQNGQCAYCGTSISFESAEMDHIVARKGPGSTNRRDNLVAVCERCNKSKSNLSFAIWINGKGSEINGVSMAEVKDRLHHWIPDPGVSSRDFKRFVQSVQRRLEQTEEDAPIDERSMESVAWMANELHARVLYYFARQGAETTVNVFQGKITAEGRKASGFEGKVNLIGGRGKTRLDRRHHAMDAATIALMRPSVAKTLIERTNIRDAERVTRKTETWKSFRGQDFAATKIYDKWLEQMEILSELFNLALSSDQIPVVKNLRLRLGNSAAHEDTIRKFDKKILSSAISAAEVDRAATPALWCALTRLPDFDLKEGLPADLDREIVVNGVHYGPLDSIEFMKGKAAAIAVRGGSVELGQAVHHARIYRIPGKKPSYGMLRVYTVDLVKHQKENLFAVELKPQTITMRSAEKKVRAALLDGTAEYLGWIVEGDELHLDMTGFVKGQIGTFMQEYSMIDRWRVDGFYSDSKLRLRPVLLSAEGLREEAIDDVKKVVDRPGWRPAVNIVFGLPDTEVVRRNVLGRVRGENDNGLPYTWKVSG